MILKELEKHGKLRAITTQPFCIYTKTLNSYSVCWNNTTNNELNIDDIDDSYGLDIEERGDTIYVYIPKNAICTLKKTSPNVDCTIIYKNIECDLVFDDDSINDYLEILDE